MILIGCIFLRFSKYSCFSAGLPYGVRDIRKPSWRGPPINVESPQNDPEIWCQTLAFRTPGDGNAEVPSNSPIFPHFMLGKSATNFTVFVSCRSFPFSQSEAIFFVPG